MNETKMTGGGLGYESRRNKEFAEAQKKERIRMMERADALLANADFCEWLEGVADAAGILTARPRLDEYASGFQEALKMTVASFVKASPRGAKWMAEYVAKRLMKADAEEAK